MVDTRHHRRKQQDLLSRNAKLQKWCWIVGLFFALVFLLGFLLGLRFISHYFYNRGVLLNPVVYYCHCSF